MKVLTVKSKEKIPVEIQRDIHYTLRMEHHTDYVITDKEAAAYSATISLDDSKPVIDILVKNSALIPEYTLEVIDLDIEAGKMEKIIVKAGNVISSHNGRMEWEN